MFHCKNGHEFSATESRGKKFIHGFPFLTCPFCGDEVPLYELKDTLTSLQNHEKRLDEISEKLERNVMDLTKVLERKRK